MKFPILCHVVVVVELLKLFQFTVSAIPIHTEDDEPHGPRTEEERREAHEAFYGGERTIEYPDHSSRNINPNLQMRWPGARVPYVIDSSLSSFTTYIEQSLEDYHTKTCIRFVRRTTETNYVRIFNGVGCNSDTIGMRGGGEQRVSIGNGCMYRGTIVHELGHVLGFYHEQNRSDRDQYIIIYWQNIETGWADQFVLLQPQQNILLNAFDYSSIMIYGNTAFSRDGRSFTMAARNGQTLINPYDKQGLTPSDVFRLGRMYNC